MSLLPAGAVAGARGLDTQFTLFGYGEASMRRGSREIRTPLQTAPFLPSGGILRATERGEAQRRRYVHQVTMASSGRMRTVHGVNTTPRTMKFNGECIDLLKLHSDNSTKGLTLLGDGDRLFE